MGGFENRNKVFDEKIFDLNFVTRVIMVSRKGPVSTEYSLSKIHLFWHLEFYLILQYLNLCPYTFQPCRSNFINHRSKFFHPDSINIIPCTCTHGVNVT